MAELALIPDQWNEILLVEDNSARAKRRRVVSVAPANFDAKVTVRLHRINGIARLSVESSGPRVTPLYDALLRLTTTDFEDTDVSSSLRRTGICLWP